jgi:hypothetical protein
MHEQDEAIVRAFISPERRTRWLEQLASAKRRPRMLDRLNHCRDIDVRYAALLPSNVDVVALMRSRGAPATCYVLSSTDEIDGRIMPLEDAVFAAEMGGWGTILSCIPGRLAFYYDECGTRRMLLERPAGEEKKMAGKGPEK